MPTEGPETPYVPVAVSDFISLQTSLAGQYSLERELGRGGMGIVYLARDVSLDRLVAIKVLPPELAARRERRERFVREARTAAQLSHPHIVPIHHVGEANETVFFVMSYVEGETLGHRLRSRGALPVHQAVRIVREVAWALAYAHLRGIVHRDVKPDNVLLERDSGRALIMDFGIASAASDDPALDDIERFGTAQYVSPEQAAGASIDGRSDVYSLGVVAWQAIAGEPPFSGSPLELLEQHLRTPAPPLVTRAPAVPHAVARAIERCLEKDPNRRWTTAESLADALGSAGEAPKELPAPLRVWVAKGEFPILAMALGSMYVVPGAILLTFQAGIIIPVIVLGAAVGALFGPMLYHTRRVLGAGFGHDDLRAALRIGNERRLEELAFEYGSAPREELRRTAIITALGASAFGGAILMLEAMWQLGTMPAYVGMTLWLVASGYAFARGSGRFVQRLIDGYARTLRMKLLESTMGKQLTRLAGWKLGARGDSGHVLHQPTEVALVSSAERLFEALPKAVRKELKALPAVVKRLEGNATAMREHIVQLDRNLLELDATPGTAAEARTLLVSELRARRANAADRLRGAVTALETIRLDLLRLQAPGADAAPLTASLTGSLTATIAAANALGDEVRLLADARAEVERVLRTGALPLSRQDRRPVTPITPLPT